MILLYIIKLGFERVRYAYRKFFLKISHHKGEENTRKKLFFISVPNIKKLFFSILFDIIFSFYFIKSFYISRYLSFLNREKKFLIHIPVWGSYTPTFINFFCRNLLAPENKKYHKNFELLLTTTPESKTDLETDEIFKEINRYYTVNFILFNNWFITKLSKKTFFSGSSMYFILGLMQHFAIKICCIKKQHLLPLYPDILIEKNFLQKISVFHQSQKGVVFTNTFRSKLPEIKKYLKSQTRKKELSLSSQEIVDIQCRFPHIETLNRMLSHQRKSFSFSPQVIFKWKNSLISKSFTWSPIFISLDVLRHWRKQINAPIDNSISTLNIDKKKIYYVPDGVKLGICEMSNSNKAALPHCINNFLNCCSTEWIKIFSNSLTKEKRQVLLKQQVFSPTSLLKIKIKDMNPKEFDQKLKEMDIKS